MESYDLRPQREGAACPHRVSRRRKRRQTLRVRRGCAIDADDALVDISGAVSCLLQIAGNFPRRCPLLIDRSCDLAGDVVDFGDSATNRLNRVNGVTRGGLDRRGY